jgi:PQ loop repeat
MLITIIGLMAAALTSLSYVPQVQKALPRGATNDLSVKMLSILAVVDGCDFAGAIANCKQEVAKLMLEQAVHPLPPAPVTPIRSKRPSPMVQAIQSAVDDAENDAKAAEARAAMQAHDLQNKLDADRYQLQQSSDNLSNALQRGQDRMETANREYKNTKYGLEIDQRQRESLRRGY